MASGCVIFLDLDDYLHRVEEMNAEEEFHFLKPLQQLVREMAKKHGFILARTFGDGFLLYREASIGDDLLREVCSFLGELSDRLLGRSLSFKAAAVAGSFIAARVPTGARAGEMAIYGPAANFAGKLISKVSSGSVSVAWTKSPRADETYRQIGTRSVAPIGISLSLIRELPKLMGESPSTLVGTRNITENSASARIIFSDSAKKFLLETIKLADDKAKTTFAISTAFMVYLFNGGGWPRPDILSRLTEISELARLTTLGAATLLLLGSAGASMMVLIPRTKGASGGLFFFGSIARRSSANEYANLMEASSTADVEREFAKHNYEVSRIAVDKFGALRWSLTLMALGVGCALAYLGLSWLFQIPTTSLP